MYLAKVHVTLKPTVNDPQGLTVKGALHDLDFRNVSSVRVGKYIEVVLQEKSRSKAEAQIEDMCRRLLANLVIEEYRFELEEISPSRPNL
jgi:phosphoribosylformylglycinamidine synthase PurS subunit